MPLDPDVKRLPVDIPVDEHRRYKVLSAETDVAMKDAALSGLRLWERMNGRLPAAIVPVLGFIPGGPAYQVRPLDDCQLALDEPRAAELRLHGDEYALIVDGESMNCVQEFSLASGDYALFRPGLDPCGKIAHVEWQEADGHDHVCTVKRVLCEEPRTFTLKAENPEHQPRTIKRQRNTVRVRGVLVGKIPASSNVK